MQIWPESGTMAEAGMSPAAAQGSEGGLGGNAAAAGMPGATGGAMPKVQNAGEILLSRPESIALAALETEEDEAHGLRRARAESGLSDSQIQMLKRRATAALAKGFTLKGAQFTKRPTAQAAPEEPGLARKAVSDRAEKNAGEHPMRRSEDKKAVKAEGKTSKTKETITGPMPHADGDRGTHFVNGPRMVAGGYRVEAAHMVEAPVQGASLLSNDKGLYQTDGYGMPTPQSFSEPEGRDNTRGAVQQKQLATMLRRNRRRRG